MLNRILLYTLLLGLSGGLFQCSTFRELSIPTQTRTGTDGNRSGDDASARLRQNVVDYALRQKGARYQYAGRSPRSGFDCSGFTHYVFDAFDVSLTPVSRVQETEGKRVDLEDVRAGDLVFFRKSRGGSVFHVALVVRRRPGELTVVHSTSSRGVISENIYDSSYWRTKIMSARDVLSR